MIIITNIFSISFSDTYQANIALLLHAIIKPTSKITNINAETKKRTICKTSIKEAQDSFLLHIISSSNLKEDVQKLTSIKFQNKGNLQPLMIGVGPTLFELKEFYIYFYPVLYKFDTFAKCIDCCFKVYIALNLQYPVESELVWTFIQHYFYDIKTRFDKKCAHLNTITNEIKNYLNSLKEH